MKISLGLKDPQDKGKRPEFMKGLGDHDDLSRPILGKRRWVPSEDAIYG